MELRTVPGNFGLLKRFIRSVMTPSILFSSNFSAMGACSARRAWLVRSLWRRRARLRAIWRITADTATSTDEGETIRLHPGTAWQMSENVD